MCRRNNIKVFGLPEYETSSDLMRNIIEMSKNLHALKKPGSVMIFQMHLEWGLK